MPNDSPMTGRHTSTTTISHVGAIATLYTLNPTHCKAIDGGYLAIYPSSLIDNTTGLSPTTNDINHLYIEQNQVYALDRDHRQCVQCPMAAVCHPVNGEGSMDFHNLGAILLINITNQYERPVKVESIVVNTTKAPINGRFRVVGITRSTPYLEWDGNNEENTSDKRTLSMNLHNSNITLSKNQCTSIAVSIPPTNAYDTNRFTIKVICVDRDDNQLQYIFKKSQSSGQLGRIPRNTLIPLTVNLSTNNNDITVISPLSGTGTAASPYKITDENDLLHMIEFVNQDIVPPSNFTPYRSAHYQLDNDITLTGPINPIGTPTHNFSGFFNGNGHKITNVRVSSDNYSGLFGYITNATITNLTVNGIIVNTTSSTGDASMGAICGYAENSTLVNCRALGNATYTVNGNRTSIGGICGTINGNSALIDKCANGSTITIAGNNATVHVGGILGHTANCQEVRNCKNAGNISINIASSGGYVGGLVGYISSGAITNCYNQGNLLLNENITSSQKPYAGGCAGYCHASITNVYSSASISNYYDNSNHSFTKAGNLIGQSNSTLLNGCYYTSNYKKVGSTVYIAADIVAAGTYIGDSTCVEYDGDNGYLWNDSLSDYLSSSTLLDALNTWRNSHIDYLPWIIPQKAPELNGIPSTSSKHKPK